MNNQKKNLTVPEGNNSLIYFSERSIVGREDTITVPRNYIGFLYVNGKPKSKILQCTNENLLKKYGGDLKKEEIQVAFCHDKQTFEIKWGFGPVYVNNERLDDAYSVGVNGTITCSIKDPIQLINYFSKSTDITTEDVWQKVIHPIINDGVPVLSEYFRNKPVSIFEINAELLNIRDKMNELIKCEKIFDEMGLKVHDVTLKQIYVPEEDLNRIKERING